MIGPLAAVWLMCQTAGLVLAPVTLWAVSTALECTCGHGDHAMCPMHHRSTTSSRCSMRGADDAGTATLATLLGGVGVMPIQGAVAAVAPTVAPLSRLVTTIVHRSTPPDSPPPRA